jgi:hypothetical protein
MPATIQTRVFDHIHRLRGQVFTPKDFLDLGSRDAADQSLSRLVKEGRLKRLARGLYYLPQVNARLGVPLPPDTDEIAAAIARQTGSRLAPSGAVAANRLGLSTQVPAKPVYLTDGSSREVKVGKLVFVVKHVAPKELPLGSPSSAQVFQALRYLGPAAINDSVIHRLSAALSASQKAELVRGARYTTDWIGDIVRRVVSTDAEATAHG